MNPNNNMFETHYLHFRIKQVFTSKTIEQKWVSTMSMNTFVLNMKQIGALMLEIPAEHVEIVECGQEMANCRAEDAPALTENMYPFNYTLFDKYGSNFTSFYVRISLPTL